jgi:hypothetical protein
VSGLIAHDTFSAQLLILCTDHDQFNFPDSFKHTVVMGALPIDFPAIAALPERIKAVEDIRIHPGGYLAPGYRLNSAIAVHAACEGLQLTMSLIL